MPSGLPQGPACTTLLLVLPAAWPDCLHHLPRAHPAPPNPPPHSPPHASQQDLAHNRFAAGYPAALAGATRLQVISFQHRGVFYSNPAIALRDAIAPTAARHAVPAGNGTVPAVLVPAVAAPAAAVPGED